jgi:hypothetical protein
MVREHLRGLMVARSCRAQNEIAKAILFAVEAFLRTAKCRVEVRASLTLGPRNRDAGHG